MTFTGVPAASESGGTSRATTAPARLLSPMASEYFSPTTRC